MGSYSQFSIIPNSLIIIEVHFKLLHLQYNFGFPVLNKYYTSIWFEIPERQTYFHTCYKHILCFHMVCLWSNIYNFGFFMLFMLDIWIDTTHYICNAQLLLSPNFTFTKFYNSQFNLNVYCHTLRADWPLQLTMCPKRLPRDFIYTVHLESIQNHSLWFTTCWCLFKKWTHSSFYIHTPRRNEKRKRFFGTFFATFKTESAFM